MAETERPKILFKTGLPSRYYIPPEDVREDVFIKSETTTRCSYKGIVSPGGGAPESGLAGRRARPPGFRPFRHVLSSVGLSESGLRFKTSLSSERSVIGQRYHVPLFMQTSMQV